MSLSSENENYSVRLFGVNAGVKLDLFDVLSVFLCLLMSCGKMILVIY